MHPTTALIPYGLVPYGQVFLIGGLTMRSVPGDPNDYCGDLSLQVPSGSEVSLIASGVVSVGSRPVLIYSGLFWLGSCFGR